MAKLIIDEEENAFDFACREAEGLGCAPNKFYRSALRVVASGLFPVS